MNAIIIDDEAVAAAAMKRRIKWEKYGISQVHMAGSMRQAIQIMEEEPVDLMLCDVEMPGGSGLELYEWVRTYRPDTECVFVSCHPEYEYVRKALTMGSMDYVLKPVDYEEMDRILEEAGRRIRSRREQAAGKDSRPLRLSENDASSAGDAFMKDASAEAAPQPASAATPASAVNPATAANLESSANPAPAAAPGAIDPALYSDAVQNAVSYIRTNLEQNMSISEIADVAHLNPQYFMRVFKKETGKPVLEFITECRLHKARELLAGTSLPITEVALSAGYDNFSYFSKLFKRNEGMTPSDYRRQKRG